MSRCGRNNATIVPESVTSSTLDGSEFGSAQLPLLLLGSFVSSCAVSCLWSQHFWSPNSKVKNLGKISVLTLVDGPKNYQHVI